MTLEELQAENEALRDRLGQVLALAERLADRLDAVTDAERPGLDAPEFWEPCRFPLPPGRYARLRGGEIR